MNKHLSFFLLFVFIFSCGKKVDDASCEIASISGEKITMKDVKEISSKLQPIPPLKERIHLSVDVLLATMESENKIDRPLEGSTLLRIYRGYLAKLRKNGKDPVAHFSTLAKNFEIAVDFSPKTLSAFTKIFENLPDNEPSFSNNVYEIAIMERVISRARKVARSAVPILIEGESGTGKELLARAIHKGSTRSENPFIATK